MSLDVRPGVFIEEKDYLISVRNTWYPISCGDGIFKHEYKDMYSVSLASMRNIGDLARFDTLEEAEEFVRNICIPVAIPAKIHNDICRCGAIKSEWQNAQTGNIVWRRHRICGKPMSHRDMLDLNRPLISDFDLDDFINS